MELKKTIIVPLIFIFTSCLSAEIIKPVSNLTPYDVVKIQLDALKKNEKSKEDSGIQQVWVFAHPKNKKVTGPYERFRAMIYGDQYKILLNHLSHKVNLIMSTQEKYIYKVEVLAKDKKLFFYEWHIEKGSEINCKNCWYTTAVSIPVDQGNTI